MALCACAAPAQIAVEIPLMAPQVVRPAPAHPCEADQVRLGCRSADCLVAKQEELSSECHQFLENMTPMPSPAPAVRFDLEDWHEWNGGGMPMMEISTGMPAEFAPLLQMMFGMPPPPKPEPPPPSTHPCDREVQLCTEETHSTARPALQSCLVAHFDELSPSCKCLLHHLLGDKLEGRPAPVSETVIDVIVEPVPPPPPRMHHAVCFLVSPLIFMCLAFLIARCCIRACITKPRFAAVVPPETVVIKTVPGVEHHVEPLIAAPKIEVVLAAPVAA